LKSSVIEGAADKNIRSPMPGTITKINRKDGDILKKGESILAM